MIDTKDQTDQDATTSAAPKQRQVRVLNVPKVDKQIVTTLTDADREDFYQSCEAVGKKPAVLLRELVQAHLAKVRRERAKSAE